MAFNPQHNKTLPVTSLESGAGHEVLDDVYSLTIQIVNVFFIGRPGSRDWVLVDTGMAGCQDQIREHAETRFGKDVPPRGIILTHGHFDHIGAVAELADYWDVPVYVHAQEVPFVTGQVSYPEADTKPDGLVASLARFFPREPIDLGAHLQILPEDGSIPILDDWRWLHTPGHAPGHISLFRDSDRALISGDAFVTVEQESLYKVFTQKRELNGPPAYFTIDWQAAKASVQKLADLRPNVAMTGHGLAMAGEELRQGLDDLARRFDELAVPEHHR